MAWLAAAAPYIQAAGAAVAVGQSLGQGRFQERMGDLQAKQLKEQELGALAESQAAAREERKRAEFLSSRAVALTAKSGTGFDSPNVVGTIGDITEQGEYNALAALYAGKSSARSKRLAGQMAKFEGKQAKTQATARGLSTLMTSGDSWGKR